MKNGLAKFAYGVLAVLMAALALAGVLVCARSAPVDSGPKFGSSYPTPSGSGVPVIAAGHYATAALAGDAGQVLQWDGGPQWSAPAANWITDFDCDLSAQSPQSLNVDTTYTFCGLTWTKLNSAHDASDGGVKLSDAGLVITPDSVSNISSATFTAPTLRVPVNSVSPLATLSTPLRLWFWVSASNEAANSDQVVGGFFINNGSYNNQFTMQFFRGYSGAVDGWGAWFTVLQSNVATTTTAVPFTSNRVAVVTYPSGLLSGVSTLQLGTTVTAGVWPTLSSLVYAASPTITSGSSTNGASTASGQHTITDWNLFFAADRAASGTTGFAGTIARARIDRLPLGN